MERIDIIKQLLNGNHLEMREVNQVKHIIHGLNLALKDRLKQYNLRV